MKILYISQKNINIENEGIYSDIINLLVERNHSVTLVCADNSYIQTNLIKKRINKLEIKVGNQFGVNIIKKGLVLLSLERKMKKAIKKYLNNEEFDLVLYATPPITFSSIIKFCKKKYNCSSYLMLKDIFPQNAVDIGMMNPKGVMGLLYKYFRKKEIELYKYSEKIGCMSQANIDYVLKHNDIDKEKLELFPNSIMIKPYIQTEDKAVLKSLGIDENKLVFIFGGNLGKPQGLDFLIEGLKACKNIKEIHFIIVGKGTEQKRVFLSLSKLENVTSLDYLPKEEYLKLCKECDVGLILLDKRFTIPNYPSRTLAYMQNAMPIFACTDKVTDIKGLIEDQAKCGKWVYSNNPEDFVEGCKWFIENRAILKELGMNGRKYMEDNFDVTKHIYKIERMVETK